MVLLVATSFLLLIILFVLLPRLKQQRGDEVTDDPDTEYVPKEEPISFADLFRWQGSISRGPYLTLGLILFAIKHNYDRIIATLIFDQTWSPFNYLMPGDLLNIDGAADRVFVFGMILAAFPFIWCGLALTTRRLRDIGLPLAFLVCFFVPYVNFLFFFEPLDLTE